MGFYNLTCRWCDHFGDHIKVSKPEGVEDMEPPHPIEHPDYDDLWVMCRECEEGRGKLSMPDDEPVEIDAEVTIKQSVHFDVHRDDVPDGMSLREYVEEQVMEHYLDRVVGEIADGILESQVDSVFISEAHGMDGWGPY